MIKNTAAQRRHRIYLRAKNALRDQHQDDYTLMLERHALELDTLWANYNLAVKKLASEHSKRDIKSQPIKSKPVKSQPVKSKAVHGRKKEELTVEPKEKIIH
jgi:hypothetical protein